MSRGLRYGPLGTGAFDAHPRPSNDVRLNGPPPLLAHVQPISGESLLSLLSRACRANVLPRLEDLTGIARVEGAPVFAPFTAFDHVEALASLLHVPCEQIEDRMHPAVVGGEEAGLVWWGGVRMERRFVEARRRRVAPTALAISPHHRLAWTHRAVVFCPETLQTLISDCPRCGQPLGWNRTCGPDVCEHCRAKLSGFSSPLAPEELQPALRAAYRFISPDADVRQAASLMLPAPFCGWDPGEVFSAVCEFGVAWEHPDATKNSDELGALREGRLERLSPETVAHGYEVIVGWPGSFDALIGRTWRALNAADPQASASLRHLGVLGRHVDTRLAPTPLRRLIRDRLSLAAKAAGVPHKSARPAAGSRATLTLSEAQARFGVGKLALGRLVPDGESCVRGRLGRGNTTALDIDRLERAITALRGSIRPEAAAAVLGVPEYMLGAFIKRRLLTRVEDPDAERLAGVSPLICKRTLDTLGRRLALIPQTYQDDGASVRRSLAGRFSPIAWAALFEGVLKKRLPLGQLDPGRSGGLSARMLLFSEDIEAYLDTISPQPIPRGPIILNAEAAALVLGLSAIYVGELAEIGALPASRQGRTWEIPLKEAIAFHRGFITSADPRWSAQLGKGNRFDMSFMPDGTRMTRHLRYCPRASFNGAVGKTHAQPTRPKARPPIDAISKRLAALARTAEDSSRQAWSLPALPTFEDLPSPRRSGDVVDANRVSGASFHSKPNATQSGKRDLSNG